MTREEGLFPVPPQNSARGRGVRPLGDFPGNVTGAQGTPRAAWIKPNAILSTEGKFLHGEGQVLAVRQSGFRRWDKTQPEVELRKCVLAPLQLGDCQGHLPRALSTLPPQAGGRSLRTRPQSGTREGSTASNHRAPSSLSPTRSMCFGRISLDLTPPAGQC